MVVGRLTRAVVELVFPAHCVGCGGSGVFLCAACAAAMPRADGARCPRCWRPGPDCASCRGAPPAFDQLRAAYRYVGAVPELVRALKYRGATAVAEPMAEAIVATVPREEISSDVIVPVPLSGMRRRTRGYNQAEELANALGRFLGTGVLPRAIERRRDTPPQARSRNAIERLHNVAGAFHAGDVDLTGRSVLLVDDVTTTRSTLSACAAAAREAGAREVRCVAFATED